MLASLLSEARFLVLPLAAAVALLARDRKRPAASALAAAPATLAPPPHTRRTVIRQ
jgi:hypothetical protein